VRASFTATKTPKASRKRPQAQGVGTSVDDPLAPLDDDERQPLDDDEEDDDECQPLEDEEEEEEECEPPEKLWPPPARPNADAARPSTASSRAIGSRRFVMVVPRAAVVSPGHGRFKRVKATARLFG